MLATTILLSACSLTAKPNLTNPCDVLVKQTPSEDTARYIVKNDRPFAQSVASHRGRYAAYGCGK